MAGFLSYPVEDRMQTLAQDLNKISKHFISIGNIFLFSLLKNLNFVLSLEILKLDISKYYIIQ